MDRWEILQIIKGEKKLPLAYKKYLKAAEEYLEAATLKLLTGE